MISKKFFCISSRYKRSSIIFISIFIITMLSTCIPNTLKAKRIVAWFRNDLRIIDNPLLNILAKYNHDLKQDKSKPFEYIDLVCIYCFDSRSFKSTKYSKHKTGIYKSKFIIESVLNLRKNLRKDLDCELLISNENPEILIPKLLNGFTSGDIFVQSEYASEERKIELQVQQKIKELDVNYNIHRITGGYTLYHPIDLPYKSDCMDMPDICTDFRNKFEKNVQIRPLLPKLSKEMLPISANKSSYNMNTILDTKCSFDYIPDLTIDLGFTIEEVHSYNENRAFRTSNSVMEFEGGEDNALQRLNEWMFVNDNLKNYFDIRNGMLGESYSSKLSPWLALGCISPRYIYHESKRYEKERKIQNKSTYWLTFELIFRDFFYFYTKKYGNKIFLQGGVINSNMQWSVDEEKIHRWKNGLTGQPLVDANMRELLNTGWMSNRGRQNVASYLVYDLGIDWRVGADHFESYLIDHDVYQNYGNWNFAAGLSSKRLSKFNCVKQSNDYDPTGIYIKHWLPELRNVPVPLLFNPTNMSRVEQVQYNVKIDIDYPKEISSVYYTALKNRPQSGINKNVSASTNKITKHFHSTSNQNDKRK